MLVPPLGVGLEFVVEVAGGVVLLLGVLEVFEEVGVEDGGRDFVVAGGPLAEVDGAAALGAEWDFGGVEGNEFFADGAVERFGHGDGHAWLILQGSSTRREGVAYGQAEARCDARSQAGVFLIAALIFLSHNLSAHLPNT